MTTYNTGNPIGSAEVKDLYDNAENLDIAINSPSADVWTDRLGQARKTWRGIQSEAQLEIAQVVGEVTAQSQQYLDASIVARDEARAAASASGPIAFYGTYAAAQAAVGGLPDGGIVEVSQDETRVGARTRYKVQAGALVFVVNLDQVRVDLAASSGASLVGHDGNTLAEQLKNRVNLVVNSIAALKALDKTKYTKAFATGYYADGDGGGGVYYYDSTDVVSADNGATIIVAADGGRWKLVGDGATNTSQWGAVGAGDSTARIQAMIDLGGGKGTISRGNHLLNTGLTIDYSNVAFPGPGVSSTRVSLVGDSMHNTFLNYDGAANSFALSKIGPVSFVSPGVYANDLMQDFVLNDVGGTRTRNGIYSKNLAYADFSRLNINGFRNGLVFDSSLSSSFDHIVFNTNTTGMVLDNTTGQSLPNANSFVNCEWSGNIQAGIVGNKSGAANRFTSCRFEQNGAIGGGIAGGVFLNIDGANGTAAVVFDSCYFEGNGGIADAYLTNISALPITVVFRNCVFNRTSSAKYVTNNISLDNTGGGSIKCVLIGCGFWSTGTYVPSSARKFVSANVGCEVIDIGCTYSETTSKGLTYIPAVTSSASASAATGVATTVYTLPNKPTPAMYIVNANIGGTGDAVNYGATATVFTDGASARMVGAVGTSYQSVALSGLNIQSTQNTGKTQTLTVSITKVA